MKAGAFLGVDAKELKDLYGSDDTHNTNMRVRQFFKYASSSGINWTPSVKVNRVKLIDNPSSVDEWIALLNTLYGNN